VNLQLDIAIIIGVWVACMGIAAWMDEKKW